VDSATAAFSMFPGTMSPAPASPGTRAAALRAYKQRLVGRIPATVSAGYRSALVDAIEAQVDTPGLDCGLRWAVEAAYHNGAEPPSHEVVALCLCFGSGALEGDTLRIQRAFYARQPGLAHHMRDWSLRGLVDKHNAKVRAGDIDASLITTTAVARRKKRPASAVEDLSPGPTAHRPDPPVDPTTVYYESNNTPRLNSLVKSRHTGPKKSTAAHRGPTIPQAILDRLPPSFMDPGIGGFAQLKQLLNPSADTIQDTLPPSGRAGGLPSSGSIFGDPRGTAGPRSPSVTPVPVGPGSPLPGGDPATQDTKQAAAAAIATTTASPDAKDTPGTAGENPWTVADDAAAEARLASLAAQIAAHRRRARDKLQHAAALREEHVRAAERQPLEGGARSADVVARVNEAHSLAGRCLRHQEEAVAAISEAGRLEGERAEEAFRRIERHLDRIRAVVVGTADALGGERAACASFAAQQADRVAALKARRDRRPASQG
ncbi:hypothetical protein LZ30DRAFT_595740, partial [Colletotrichum cereale]